MKNDKELDDILSSLKDNRSRLDELLNPEPVELPKTHIENKISPKNDESFNIEEKPVETIDMPAPPEPSKRKKDEAEQEKEQKKKPKQKKDFAKAIKENASSIIPKLKALPKKKKINLAIIVGAIIVVCSIIFGIYYGTSGYVKPYERKYGVTYPAGIQKEFLDAYGKDQTIRGKIEISDTKSKAYFVRSKNDKASYLSFNSTIDSEDQFTSIRLNHKDFDLEKVYSTPNSFLKSSQEIKMTTLYKKEQSYKVVASYYTNSQLTKDDSYVFPYNLYGNMTQKSFFEFEDKIESRRLYDTGYEFNYNDKFLVLSTESDFMPYYVFVVVCVKTDDMQKSKIAKANDNVHYPNSYYTTNELHNPYHFAPEWYPEIIIDSKPVQTEPHDFAF